MLRKHFKVKTIYQITRAQVDKFFKSLTGGRMYIYFKDNYLSNVWGEKPAEDDSPALKLATMYGDQILKSKTLDDLSIVWTRVKDDIKKMKGWQDWLQDLHDSAKETMLSPEIPFMDTLNAEGLKAFKAGLI